MSAPVSRLVLLLWLPVFGLLGLVAACSISSQSQPQSPDALATTDQVAGEQAEIPTPKVENGDVVWIQKRLQQLGYYNGPVDGAVGQATRSAVEAYQQDQGLESDGQPTTELREFMWRNGG